MHFNFNFLHIYQVLELNQIYDEKYAKSIITLKKCNLLHLRKYKRALKSYVQLNKLRHDLQIKTKYIYLPANGSRWKYEVVKKISNEERWIS